MDGYPTLKTVVCLFCGATVRLVRRGRETVDGIPRFWYIESTWAEGQANHFCEWKLNRPAEAGPLPEKPVPVYGPWKVDFSEGRP